MGAGGLPGRAVRAAPSRRLLPQRQPRAPQAGTDRGAGAAAARCLRGAAAQRVSRGLSGARVVDAADCRAPGRSRRRRAPRARAAAGCRGARAADRLRQHRRPPACPRRRASARARRAPRAWVRPRAAGAAAAHRESCPRVCRRRARPVARDVEPRCAHASRAVDAATALRGRHQLVGSCVHVWRSTPDRRALRSRSRGAVLQPGCARRPQGRAVGGGAIAARAARRARRARVRARDGAARRRGVARAQLLAASARRSGIRRTPGPHRPRVAAASQRREPGKVPVAPATRCALRRDPPWRTRTARRGSRGHRPEPAARRATWRAADHDRRARLAGERPDSIGAAELRLARVLSACCASQW